MNLLFTKHLAIVMSEASGLATLLEDLTTHAARNPESEVQLGREYNKLTDAQQATRELLTMSTKAKKELLTADVDALLLQHTANIELLATAHDVLPEHISKLISTASRYKPSRAPTLQNAMLHAKAQEVNDGKCFSPLVLIH